MQFHKEEKQGVKFLHTTSKSFSSLFECIFSNYKVTCHKKYQLDSILGCLVDISAFLIYSVGKHLQGKCSVYPPGA